MVSSCCLKVLLDCGMISAAACTTHGTCLCGTASNLSATGGSNQTLKLLASEVFSQPLHTRD